MMLQATMVGMQKMVMEEQEAGGMKVLYMGEEEVEIEEMLAMKGLMMNMKISISTFVLIADVLEEATVKIGLVNWNLPCQNLMVDLTLKLISLGS
jgi:hypothetical protein